MPRAKKQGMGRKLAKAPKSKTTTSKKAPKKAIAKKSKKMTAAMAARRPGTVKEVRTKTGVTFFYKVLPSRKLKRIPAPTASKAVRGKARGAMKRHYNAKGRFGPGIRSDIKRKNKRLTNNLATYSKNPGRYDMKGVDTPGSYVPKLARK